MVVIMVMVLVMAAGRVVADAPCRSTLSDPRIISSALMAAGSNTAIAR